MKAETEAVVADIEKSLELLRQRLGWETAKHRLEELDARAEDPTLWDDPGHAQKIMRDRQKLADAIEGDEELATGLSDNSELIELGEAEGDDEIVELVEAFVETLRGQSSISAELPYYVSHLPYYQRMLATALSASLARSWVDMEEVKQLANAGLALPGVAGRQV